MYALSALLVFVAHLLRLQLPFVHYQNFYLFYVIAVVFTAVLAGIGPALLATVLSAIASATTLHRAGGMQWASYGTFVVTLLLICALTYEIRRRNRVQLGLLLNQARLAAVVESSDDAIFTKSLEGIILSWNQGAQKMYGYKPHEVIGRHVSMLSPVERRHEIARIMETLRRGHAVEHLETDRLTKDGRKLRVTLTISPIYDTEGRVVAASTTARDISERVMAEQALRQADKLSAAGRMAATIAHEINNPLDSVLSSMYLLERQPLPPQSAHLIAIVRRETARIAHIVKQTLGFYRESARPILVRIPEILDEIVSLYQQKLTSQKITVEKRFDESNPLRAFPGELRQVFTNLVINAAEAMPAGGRLVLHVFPSKDWHSGAQGTRVIIADTGSGVEPAARKHIFEPFYTTKGERGTGLGLWVSVGLVAKHHGHIRLRSRTRSGASGTCFNIFFPYEGVAAVGEQRAA